MRFRVNGQRAGFSLIELSIVLVILGLLAGGVLSGQSLIRAAELRSVSQDISRFNTAIYSFRDKYMALPGDMANAQTFWPGGTLCAPGDKAGTGVCNGDGNGQIMPSSASVAGDVPDEIFQFWLHLAKAGLIEGSYTGRAGPSSTASGRGAVPGSNAPRGRIANTGYSVEYWGNQSGSSITWNGNYGNAYIFGGAQSVNPPETEVLKPEEAWNIDKKLDDGMPSTGFITTFFRYSYNPHKLTDHCTDGDGDGTANYNLISSSVVCNLMIKTGF